MNTKKRFSSFIRNESGVGILQMLVLVAISLAMIGAMATSIVNMMKSQQTVSQSLEADLWADQVTQLLADSQTCSTVVTPFLAELNGSPQDLAFTAKKLDLSTGPIFLKPGTDISENFKIASIKNTITSGSGTTVVSAGVTLRHFDSVLRIGLQKRNTSTFVQSLQPFELKMHLMVNSSNQAVACSADSAGAMACTQQGGIWNPQAPDGQKCVASKYCQYGGSYGVASDADGGFVNGLTGDRSCPSGFTAQQSGTINKAVAGGKYSVSNVPSPIMTCMACGIPVTESTNPYTGSYAFGGNQDVYEAVVDAADSDDRLAAADAKIAYNNWQGGVSQSNSLKTQIDNYTQAKSDADANYSNAVATQSTAQQNYNQAVNDYNSAVNAYNSNPNATTQAARDSAQANQTNAYNALQSANADVSSYANQSQVADQNIKNFTQAKQNQDATNETLHQTYLAAQKRSDDLHAIYLAQKAAAKKGQEPPY